MIMVAIFPVGIPFVMFMMLCQLRKMLNPSGVDEQQVIKDREQDHEFVTKYPIVNFALLYRPKFYYFEAISLLKRLLLTSGAIGFDDRNIMTIYVLIVATLGVVLDRESMPYTDPTLSFFAYVMEWELVVSVLFMMIRNAGWTDRISDFTAGILLLTINLILLVIAIQPTPKSRTGLFRVLFPRPDDLRIVVQAKVAPEDQEEAKAEELWPKAALDALETDAEDLLAEALQAEMHWKQAMKLAEPVYENGQVAVTDRKKRLGKEAGVSWGRTVAILPGSLTRRGLTTFTTGDTLYAIAAKNNRQKCANLIKSLLAENGMSRPRLYEARELPPIPIPELNPKLESPVTVTPDDMLASMLMGRGRKKARIAASP